MTHSVDYLDRGLDRRVKVFGDQTIRRIEQMMAQHAAKGALGSGATLRKFQELSIEGLTGWFADATTFVYSVTEKHDSEVSSCLERAASDLRNAISEYTRQRGRNTGINENTVQTQVDEISNLLKQKQAELLDDFLNGMLGSNRMKKDPLVSLTAHQSNSPGAVQQLGVASDQRAQVQTYQAILDTISEIVGSNEFESLTPEQKASFADMVEVIKDEASKPTPDAGKIRRWSEKLKAEAADFGMKVGTSAIAQIIARLFVG